MKNTLHIQLEERPNDEDLIYDGIEQDGQRYGIAPATEVAAFIYDDAGQICGGAYGDLGWDYLYTDILWVSAAHRGQGNGRHSLNALERAALQRGIDKAYLATTSFQSLQFYYHQGYRLFGVLEDRPPGHRYYYLHKTMTNTDTNDLPPVIENPARDSLRVLAQGLSQYNRQQGAQSGSQRLTVTLRDDDGHLCGGLTGATYWGWLDIQAMWIDTPWRGRGYGKALLAEAEAESLRRGVVQAVIDVATFQSLGFFQRHEYTTFATLAGRPAGQTTHFLRKALKA